MPVKVDLSIMQKITKMLYLGIGGFHIHSRNSFLKLGTIIYYQNYAIFLKNICTVIIRLGERNISVTCLSFFIKNAKNEQIVPYHLISDI